MQASNGADGSSLLLICSELQCFSCCCCCCCRVNGCPANCYDTWDNLLALTLSLSCICDTPGLSHYTCWLLHTQLRVRNTILYNTRSPAVAKIADRTGCQWPSRSSKVDDFHFSWKSVCHFLLVIDSSPWLFMRYGQFFVENAHFSYPLHLIPILKMFPLQ